MTEVDMGKESTYTIRNLAEEGSIVDPNGHHSLLGALAPLVTQLVPDQVVPAASRKDTALFLV